MLITQEYPHFIHLILSMRFDPWYLDTICYLLDPYKDS